MGLLDSVLVSLAASAPQPGTAQHAPPGAVLGNMVSRAGSLGQVAAGSSLQGPLLQALATLLANDAPGGGLETMVGQFQGGGLGDVMASWIGRGANRSVTPGELGAVLGSDRLDGLAQQFGVSHGVLLAQLAQMLPVLVDRLTPNGAVPEGGLGSMSDLLGGLLQR